MVNSSIETLEISGLDENKDTVIHEVRSWDLDPKYKDESTLLVVAEHWVLDQLKVQLKALKIEGLMLTLVRS